MLEYPITYYISHTISYLFSQPAILTWMAVEHFYFKAKKWQNALILLMVLMPVNTILKAIIAVPLMPPMVGFAIPSGHTHAALAFWGYLAYQYRATKTGKIMVLLLLLFFWSLVHRHYHSWLDVGVAIACFVVELFVFEQYFKKYAGFGLLAILSILAAYYGLGITQYPTVSILMLSGFILAKGYDLKLWLGLMLVWVISFFKIQALDSEFFIPLVLGLAVYFSDKQLRDKGA